MSKNKPAQEVETLIAQAYYIAKELRARKVKLDNEKDLITEYLIHEKVGPSWGYENIKNIVSGVLYFVEVSKYLESYSGAIYKSFESFLEEK